MKKAGLNQLMHNFSQNADSVKDQFSGILGAIKEGKAPAGKNMRKLNSAVDALRANYDSIRVLAKGAVPENELPAEGSSIWEYQKAVETSRKVRRDRELNDISETIEKFISVRSSVSAYAKALEPYQKAAATVLETLGAITNDPIPDSVHRVSNECRLFLKAMDIGDSRSDAAVRLLTGLDNAYPGLVQVGLVDGIYTLPEGEYTPAGGRAEQAAAELPHDLPVDDATTPPAPDESEAPGIRVNREDKPVRAPLLKSKYRFKRTKASASAFKSLILRMPKSIQTVLPLFTNLGALTADQATRFGICMDSLDPGTAAENIEQILENLAAKGYVVAYESAALPTTVFCLSRMGYTCMHKEMIAVKMRNFWNITYGQYKLVGTKKTDASIIISAITNNSLLLSYLGGIRSGVGKNDYSTIKASIKWVGNHYQAAVLWGGQRYDCRIIEKLPQADAPPGGNLLVVADDLPDLPADQKHTVFAYVNDHLHYFDGTWTKPNQPDSQTLTHPEKPAESPDPGDETQTATVTRDIKEPAAADGDQIPDPTPEGAPAQNTDAPYGGENFWESAPAIIKSSRTPSDTEFVLLIDNLLNAPAKDNAESGKHLKQAILLAKATAYVAGAAECRAAYERLALATNLFPNDADYSGVTIEPLFPEYAQKTEGTMLATYMMALLSPSQKHDHMLYSRAKAHHSDYEAIFPSYPFIKPLFHRLIDVQGVAPEGFSDSIVGLLGDAAEKSAFAKSLRENAHALLNLPVIKAKMSGLPELCQACFGKGSYLHLCMDVISKNDVSERDCVAEILQEYTDREGKLQPTLIGTRMDREWNEATKGKRTNKLKLGFLARDQVQDAFEKRLRLMQSWLEHVDNKNDQRLPGLRTLRATLLGLVDDAQAVLNKKTVTGNDRIVLWALDSMYHRLSGNRESRPPFADLLLTGYISLDRDWSPILNRRMTKVKYFEPWRNVLRHIMGPEMDPAEVKQSIFDGESPLFDNLRQLEMLECLTGGDTEQPVISEAEIRIGADAANECTREFTDALEMAYTYNRIDEADKENLLSISAQHKEPLYKIGDFACWRAFLDALKQQVAEKSQARKTQLRTMLEAKRESLPAEAEVPLLDRAEALLEEEYYAVAEEYINRFDSGETEAPEELHTASHEKDSYKDYVSDEVFRPIYDACRRGNGRSLKSFGMDFVDKHLPKDWTHRLKDNSKRLLAAWPTRKGQPFTKERLRDLFKYIGLNVKRVNKISSSKVEVYHVHAARLARNQADYRHPIAAFGTQLKSPLSVVVLFGSYTAKQLVDTVTSLGLGGMAIVLLDRAYDLASRRQVAEIFRTETSRQNPFLLIDQTLLLYLAMHQETERLPVMLKCTLPYTTYQPFVRGGGSTADEMFYGRTSELSEIMNPGGACIVYGGRQLGKTALLERAESLCLKPKNKEYAVYCSIQECHDEPSLLKVIMDNIHKKTDLRLTRATTTEELCRQLDGMFRNGNINTMLLLLDEADNFLVSAGKDDYKPLQPLINLKRESKNNFKFVFAGLHNVYRAHNATANNGVFGQLGAPLCIKPLSPMDALSLIGHPLRYLGFYIDHYPHLITILTNTNYYPGILQFFGYTLVETFNSDYTRYYRAVDGHPPFTLWDEQLGSVMNSADLNSSIREKFLLSLKLDPRYFMLARCITMLYHLNDGTVAQGSLGFSVDDIYSLAEFYSIRCLLKESHTGYVNLLDEMVEMGILARPVTEIYRLRRHSFINIIGSNMDSLEKEIIRANEGAAK